MKKIIIVSLLSMFLVGCGKPKSYGDIANWSAYDTEDFHVTYAMGIDGCYSDGSVMSNMLYNDWIEKYKQKHY